MLVEVIFQYRSLVGKSELGVGLDWDEIEQITSIESAFAPGADDRRMSSARPGAVCGRQFRRHGVQISAVMRGDQIHDRIEIIEVGPGGMVCRKAPYIARGEQVELVIDTEDYTYRFRAQGVWLKDDDDDYRVGFALIGIPVRLHKVALSEHQLDVVDKIAAAA